MGNPNTNTETKPSLKLNNEERNITLNVVLDALRNPENKFGRELTLPEDKHYPQNMRIIEAIGYSRNADKNCFCLPQKEAPCPFKQPTNLGPVVQLADNDSRYVERMTWLENNGYNRNAQNNCWELDQASIKALHRKTRSMNVFNMTKKATAAVFVGTAIVVGIVLDNM